MTPLFAFAAFLNLVVAQSLRGTGFEWCAEGWVEEYRDRHDYPTHTSLRERQAAWEST